MQSLMQRLVCDNASCGASNADTCIGTPTSPSTRTASTGRWSGAVMSGASRVGLKSCCSDPERKYFGDDTLFAVACASLL